MTYFCGFCGFCGGYPVTPQHNWRNTRMTERTLRSVPVPPPEDHPEPTFVRVTDAAWKAFTLATTVACPECAAKPDYPCMQLVAGYHVTRLYKANRPQRKAKGDNK